MLRRGAMIVGDQTRKSGRRHGSLGLPVILYVAGAALILAAANLGTFVALGVADSKVGLSDRALDIAESDLDMGEVWLQYGFEWHVRLRNTTHESLDIDRIGASCSCTSVSPTFGRIGPQGVLDVALKLNLSPKNALQAAEPSRPFAADLIATTRQSARPYSWRLHGTVKSPLTFNPMSLDFGEILNADGSRKTLTLDVESTSPLAGMDARCDGARFSTHVEQVSAMRWKVRVTPTRLLPPGPFDTFVYLAASLRNEQKSPEIPVQVNGVAMADAHVSPSSIFFGAHSRSTAEVTLSTHSGRPITKMQMDPHLPKGVRIAATDGGSGGTRRFSIECYDRGTRTASGAIRFTLFAEGDAEATIDSLSIVVQGQKQ